MGESLFIILGATGDLAKREIIPAIYYLVKNKKLERFAIIGAARREVKISTILNEAKKYVKDLDSKVWKKIEKAAYYHVIDFYKHADYEKLGRKIKDVEKEHSLKGNRMFYLATLPQHFDKITHYLSKFNLGKSKGWDRVVYEKPFGEDYKSAKKINKCIERVFKENQVYRIDHYLGKEVVANIALSRFTNRVLEPLWNREHVKEVQINLSETLGVKNRANFYDKTGALKDVVQNHMMQVLALTAMDEPKNFKAENIRNAKVKVLKNVKIEDVLLGQYEGYQKEVKKNSNTETFAALKLHVNTPRWKGVPFYLKTGKKLDKREGSIRLIFKRVKCLLDFCPRDTNELELRIQPDLGFALHLNAKVPGKQEVMPVKMDFCYSCIGLKTPEAYEVLLDDVIRGDQSSFIRNDEIEYSWKIIDKIKKGKIHKYKEGSKGPIEVFEKKHKMRWKV